MAPEEHDWIGCYGESWKEITSESFSHPAKFSRALIRRIYEHALERGYLQEGDVCLDPFGGVALGATDALANGLNFVGVELEQFFVDLGAGCDCTGISKTDWVRSINRRKRFAYRDDRHWCPQCLAEAERVIAPRPPTLPGMEIPTASYQRSSGKIPHTEPHHYTGNLELFAKHARDGATAVLLQGDSRDLARVLDGARAEGIVASPPYLTGGHHKHQMDAWNTNEGGQGFTPENQGYGTDPANLGNMPAGDVDAVIASPPYSNQPLRNVAPKKLERLKHLVDQGIITGRESVRVAKKGFNPNTQVAHQDDYGTSDGQLAALPEGEPPSAVISSPPLGKAQSGGTGFWEGLGEKHGRKFSDRVREGSQGYREDQLGDSDGQLGTMPTGEPPQAIVSSPPFENSMDTIEDKDCAGGTSVTQKYQRGYPGQRLTWQNQGRTELGTWAQRKEPLANLGRNDGDTFWSAARAILQQCHHVLAPGGRAMWVLKAFVRNKAIVDFPGQWRALCEACGFKTVEVIRAWLVEDRGAQFTLGGELEQRRVARKSFFRRLHESKYPDLAIDYEIVLITRKRDNLWPK